MKLRSVIYRLTLAMALTFVSACAFKPLVVDVAPSLQVAESAIGNGTAVTVAVTDQRKSEQLGTRTISGKTAPVNASVDLKQTLQQELSQALAAKGFTIADVSSEVTLELQLLKTEYVTKAAAVGATTTLNTEVKVVAVKGNTTYEKVYRTEREEKTAFAPMAEQSAGFINAAISETLQRVLDDEALINSLLAAN